MKKAGKKTNWWKVGVITVLSLALAGGVGYGIYAIVDYAQDKNQEQQEEVQEPTDDEQETPTEEQQIANDMVAQYIK